MRKELNIILSFIFLMLVWGSSFILIKQGLSVFSWVEVASIRLSAAMFVMIGFAAFHLKSVPKEKLIHLFISAFTAMGGSAYLFAAAQQPNVGVSSSISGVLNSLTPLMTFILGVIFFQQPLTRNKAIGLLLGFAGAATLILVNPKGGITINSYGFLVVLATLGYGFNVNYIKKHLSDLNPFHLSSITITMVGLIAFSILMTTPFWEKAQTAPNGWQALGEVALLGVLGTATAQIVFNQMLTHTSALVASSITYFIPIVAVLWGVHFGEVLLPWHYLGMVLIIGGVLILNRLK